MERVVRLKEEWQILWDVNNFTVVIALVRDRVLEACTQTDLVVAHGAVDDWLLEERFSYEEGVEGSLVLQCRRQIFKKGHSNVNVANRDVNPERRVVLDRIGTELKWPFDFTD